MWAAACTPGLTRPYSCQMAPYGDVSDGSHAASGVNFPSWQQPGEQVLWTGRPDPRVLIPGAAIAGIVIGAVFLAVGLFWEHLLRQVNAPSVAYQTGLPPGLVPQSEPTWFGGLSSGLRTALMAAGLLPILLGAWLAIGRPIRDVGIRRRTTYAITDRRAVIMTASRMIDTPVFNQPANVRRSHAGRVFADIGTPVPHYSTAPGPPGANGMPGPSSTTVRYVAPVTFRLVADGDAMVAALGQARSGGRGALDPQF
jgi:hypothetical protein